MARRAVITLAATSAGVALVMSFKTPQTTGASAGGSALGTLPDAASSDQTVAPDTAAQPATSTTTAAAQPPTTASAPNGPATTSTTATAKSTGTTSSALADAPTTAAAAAPTTTTSVVRAPSTTFFQTTTTTRPAAKGVPAGASGTFDGDLVTTGFGDVQVEISVTGGKIVDVTALALPSDRARSAAISQYAGPMLRQEALTAQTAAIDIVSGATYTSMGYSQSLQSAIDKA